MGKNASYAAVAFVLVAAGLCAIVAIYVMPYLPRN